MIETRAADVQPRRPAGPSSPLGQAVPELAAVRLREQIQHGLHPVGSVLSGCACRHRLAPDEGLEQPHALVGEEKKRAVAPQGAAQGGAQIVHSQRPPRVAVLVGKPVVGVKYLVAKTVEQRPVQSIRPRSAAQRYLPAGQPAELRHRRRCLHAHFLQRIAGEQAVQAAERGHPRQRRAGGLRRQTPAAHARIRADAVYGEIIHVGPLSGDAELAGFAASGRRHHHTRRELDQA